MTKADIARVVYERHGGISNREAARLVEVIFETIKRHLGDGEKVQITGFGTFLVMLVGGAIAEIPCVGWVAPAVLGLLGLGAVAVTWFGTRLAPIAVTASPEPVQPSEPLPPAS